MAETEMLVRKTDENLDEARTVGLLVAIPACADRESLVPLIERVKQAVHQLSAPCAAAIALPAETTLIYKEAMLDSDESDPLDYVGYTLPASSGAPLPWMNQALTSETILTLAIQANAHACTVLGAEACDAQESFTGERLSLLLGPCLDGGVDLVMPLYSTQAYDDLLNKAILYPLSRSLYGKRVRYPLADAFQVSGKFMLSTQERADKGSALQQGRLLWLASAAANRNLKICQVYLGQRTPQNYEGIELSDALAQLAGGLFLDMEDNAAAWQRVRGSVDVPTFGNYEHTTESTKLMDVSRMVEAFQLGVRNLHEIWSLILPPATILELKKTAALPAERFHLSDGLWARVVYDFALAHRLRNVHRTHLFGALKPLYLGWVASYVNDVASSGVSTAEERVEALARTFEAEKSYLVSRWRWPDRFHP